MGDYGGMARHDVSDTGSQLHMGGSIREQRQRHVRIPEYRLGIRNPHSAEALRIGSCNPVNELRNGAVWKNADVEGG